MMPMTGPNDSSRITRIEWSTPTSTVGPRYGEAGSDAAKSFFARACGRAGVERLRDLPAHRLGRGRIDHRADRGRKVAWVAEHVVAHRRDELFDEWRVDVAVHIDAFDAAARLAGVEERAVDELGHAEVEVAIGPHIGGVLAAELEPGADEPRARGPFDRVPTADGTGEGNEVDARIGDHAADVVVVGVHVLQHAVGQPGGAERLFVALGTQQRLGGVFEHHRVAGEQRGHHDVDGGEVRIVPGRHHEHGAHRITADVALETVGGGAGNVGEFGGCDGGHVAGALLEPARDLGWCVPRSAGPSAA